MVSLPNLKIPDNLKNKVWFSNLEGAIEEDSKNLIDRFVVFNDDSKFISSDLKNYWIKIRRWFIMFLLFTNIKK